MYAIGGQNNENFPKHLNISLKTLEYPLKQSKLAIILYKEIILAFLNQNGLIYAILDEIQVAKNVEGCYH